MRRIGGRTVVLAGVLVACAAPTQAQAAPSAPSLYTGGSSALTASSVSLGGGINPNGQETSFYFQYGPTTGYGAQTPSASAGSGAQMHTVSAPVGGLVAYAVYHYRLVAANATGTSFGGDHTFTTKKIPLTFRFTTPAGRDVFGSPFTVAGTVSGTGSAGLQLALLGNTFPFLAGFKNLGAPVLTDANGGFSFDVSGLSQNTQLRVTTVEKPPVTSGVMTERVAVRVTLHVRQVGRKGFARLYGTVAPAQVLAPVSFQLLQPGRRPRIVARAQAKTARGSSVSRFDRLVRIPHAGLYRAFVTVLSGAQVSNHSRAVAIR